MPKVGMGTKHQRRRARVSTAIRSEAQRRREVRAKRAGKGSPPSPTVSAVYARQLRKQGKTWTEKLY